MRISGSNPEDASSNPAGPAKPHVQACYIDKYIVLSTGQEFTSGPWGTSSIGGAIPLQGIGSEFESLVLHSTEGLAF